MYYVSDVLQPLRLSCSYLQYIFGLDLPLWSSIKFRLCPLLSTFIAGESLQKTFLFNYFNKRSFWTKEYVWPVTEIGSIMPWYLNAPPPFPSLTSMPSHWTGSTGLALHSGGVQRTEGAPRVTSGGIGVVVYWRFPHVGMKLYLLYILYYIYYYILSQKKHPS